MTDRLIDDIRREQLHLAAALHDIGKMIVPLSVLSSFFLCNVNKSFKV